MLNNMGVQYHTRYMHVHHLPPAEHMQTSIGRNGEVQWRQCCAVFAYLVHGSASKGNRLMHRSSPVTVILSSFIYLLSS